VHTNTPFLPQVHIERTALCESQAEGKRLAWDTPNVNSCFGTDGSKYYRKWVPRKKSCKGSEEAGRHHVTMSSLSLEQVLCVQVPSFPPTRTNSALCNVPSSRPG
jgi:hypothetical protein